MVETPVKDENEAGVGAPFLTIRGEVAQVFFQAATRFLPDWRMSLKGKLMLK